jgi:hypothetical protein
MASFNEINAKNRQNCWQPHSVTINEGGQNYENRLAFLMVA